MPTLASLHYFAHESLNYSRPAMILIHGAGAHHLFWPPQIRRLAGQRTFALDLPGHGRSGGVGHHRIEDYVASVLDLMRGLGVNAAVWVGHSMGGAIALEAALRHPQRVLGLGLIGSGARLRVDPVMLRKSSEEATFSAALSMMGARSFSAATPPRLRELAMQRMSEMRSTVLHGDWMACDNFDVMDRLSTIDRPALIVCGVEDQMTPVGYSKYLQAHIPGSQLHIIPDAGHMVMLEQPDRTAQLLDRFLESIAYQPGL